MNIQSISDFRRAFRNGPYAWPGGYPVYFLLSDGEAISFKAAREKSTRREMLAALRDNNTRCGWMPIALEINWEDENLYCVQTSERIESAYGEEHDNDT